MGNSTPASSVRIRSAADTESDPAAARRRFSTEYKLRILQEVDNCASGGIAALLHREGLYWSHLTTWRRQREAGQLLGLGPKKPGPKPDPQAAELRRLRLENERLQVRLRQAEAEIDALGHKGTAQGDS